VLTVFDALSQMSTDISHGLFTILFSFFANLKEYLIYFHQ